MGTGGWGEQRLLEPETPTERWDRSPGEWRCRHQRQDGPQSERSVGIITDQRLGHRDRKVTRMAGHTDILRQDQGAGTHMAWPVVAWGRMRWHGVGTGASYPKAGLESALPSERPWPDVSSSTPHPQH